jgi:hypothetical protein
MPQLIDRVLRAGERKTLRKLKALVSQIHSIPARSTRCAPTTGAVVNAE